MCGLSTPWVEGDLSPGPKVTLGVGVLSTPWVEDDLLPGSKVTLDMCGLSTSWVGDLSPWPKVTHDLSPGPEVSLDVCELASPWVEGDLSPGPKVTLGVGVLSTPWVGESSVTFYQDPWSTWICHVWYSLPDIWGGWHDLSPGPKVNLDVLNVRCPLAEMCGGASHTASLATCVWFFTMWAVWVLFVLKILAVGLTRLCFMLVKWCLFTHSNPTWFSVAAWALCMCVCACILACVCSCGCVCVHVREKPQEVKLLMM